MTSSLTPSMKAGAEALPDGAENCGCCAGVAVATPQAIGNRIGLSEVAYRTGDQAQVKASLLSGLSSAALPALARLRTRDDDDYTIGLADAFACAADVLGFYQERIAQESWLRTATERVSLQELGRLIGYRLRPGLAAETWLAISLESPPARPPALKPEPGLFIGGVPATVQIDAGLKVQSVPGPGEQPQTFETVTALEARPAWNAMQPWMAELRRAGRGDRVAYLAGVRNNLKAGDGLLFVGDELQADAGSDRWDFRLLASVTLDADADLTRVTWQRGLGSIDPWNDPAQVPRVYALRRRASPFGHNAPLWQSMSDAFRADYSGNADPEPTEWPGFTIASAGAGHVDLDAPYNEVAVGSWVVLAKGEFNRPSEPMPRGSYVELYRVTGTAEVSRAAYAMSGKVTRLALAGENLAEAFSDATDLRRITAFVQSEELAFAPYPIDHPLDVGSAGPWPHDVALAKVPVAAPADGLLAGRPVLVTGTQRADGAAVVHAATLTAVSAVSAAAGGSLLAIDPPLPAALARKSVVMHANVALATHGETVSQLLGNGNAADAFQRFELKQVPLTHRAAANASGAAPEITLRVGDVAWTRRDILYGAGPNERAYALDIDETGRQWVRFGDGVQGARLPTGQSNVRAVVRKGLGAQGNVRADALTQLSTRPLGVKGASNPAPAQGGTDAESADDARRSMPLGVRTLGRAVSLLDYEDFARAFSGVAKAQAAVLPLAGGATVAITIAGAGGAPLDEANPVWINLLAALKGSGDPHVPVLLLGYQASTFEIGLKVKIDAAYDAKAVLAAVEAALRTHYAFDARELGQPVQQSDVIAAAHTVPGVVAVDLDFLYGGTAPLVQTGPSRQVRLLASRLRVEGGAARAAELLTLDPGPLKRLEVMT